MIAGDDENTAGVEAGRLAERKKIGSGVGVLLAGLLARTGEGVTAEGDVAGDEDGMGSRGALPKDGGEIPLQLTGDEYLVPAVGGVAMPKVEVRDVDPRE